MRRTLLLLLAVVVLMGAAAPAQIDNPVYTSWAKHKAGTNVVTKKTSDEGGTASESQTTYTLIEVAANHVIVEAKISVKAAGTTVDMPGKKTTIPAKIDPPERPKVLRDAKGKLLPPTTKTAEKDDTIEVAGKSYKCKVKEVENLVEGERSLTTTWLTDEIPNGYAKTETVIYQGAMRGTTTVTVSSITLR